MGPTLTAGSRLASRRWAVVAMIVLAILLQAALSTLASSFGSRPADELVVFFQALIVATVLTLPGVAIVAFIDRRERESPWLYAFALGWGMLGAAGLSLMLNSEALRSMLSVTAQVGGGMAAVTGFSDMARLFVAVVFAPPIEELTKAIALVLLVFFLRGQFFTMRDGIVFGLLVGMGFNLLEAPFYLMNGYAADGVVPWQQQLLGRFLFLGLNGHALYTALLGAGLGYLAQRGGTRGLLGAVGGAAAAIVAHMLNNALGGVVLGLILTVFGYDLSTVSDAAAFFANMPAATYWLADALATVILQGWAYLLLAVLLVRSARYERRVIAEELAHEIGGAITPEEYAGIGAEGRFALRRLPGIAARTSRDLVNAQNRIALLRARARHEGRDPNVDVQVVAWRAEVERLRSGLAGGPAR
jgi:RsiW-degrading membrane proteinase PrsW (M82 family)